MSLFIDSVSLEITGEEANAVWRAVDRLASTQPDGPQRRMLDGLNAKVGDAIRDATLSEQRGHRAIEHISATPMGEELADLLDQNVRDRRAA